MEDLPLVSIVVPCYNGEKYIKDCLESLLMQKYPNKEIIVVDDGSTDSSAVIIQAMDPCIKYVFQENAGSAVARNTGIEHASGKYITFNDGDDIWVKNRLHQQVNFLEMNPKYGVAVGRFQHVDANFDVQDAQEVDDSEPLGIIAERSGWVYHTLFETSWYHIIAAMVRVELLDEVKFNPSYRRGQDYDFWLQLAHRTQVAQLNTTYAYYRKNLDSISHLPHLRNYRAEIMENALSSMGSSSQSGESVNHTELNNLFFKVWFEYGYELFCAKWYRLSLNAFFKAIKYKPMKFSGYKFALRTLLVMPFDKSPK